MRIHIWIHKNDAISGKINDYHLTRPYIDRHDEWVEISITPDEFARLND